MKKIVKLIDKNQVSGDASRALRRILKEIEDGECTNIVLGSVRRDGSIYTFSTGTSPVSQLGILSIISTDIITEQFKSSKAK